MTTNACIHTGLRVVDARYAAPPCESILRRLGHYWATGVCPERSMPSCHSFDIVRARIRRGRALSTQVGGSRRGRRGGSSRSYPLLLRPTSLLRWATAENGRPRTKHARKCRSNVAIRCGTLRVWPTDGRTRRLQRSCVRRRNGYAQRSINRTLSFAKNVDFRSLRSGPTCV